MMRRRNSNAPGVFGTKGDHRTIGIVSIAYIVPKELYLVAVNSLFEIISPFACRKEKGNIGIGGSLPIAIRNAVGMALFEQQHLGGSDARLSPFAEVL